MQWLDRKPQDPPSPPCEPRGGSVRSLVPGIVVAGLVLGLSTLIDAAPSLAQGTSETNHNGWRLRHWTTADGLPQNWVNFVAQTPDGMLWAGTSTGLARLEGDHFRRVDSTVDGQGLLANTHWLYTGPQGRLWLSNGGALYHSRDGRRFVQADEGFGQGPPGRFLTTVHGTLGVFDLENRWRTFDGHRWQITEPDGDTAQGELSPEDRFLNDRENRIQRITRRGPRMLRTDSGTPALGSCGVVRWRQVLHTCSRLPGVKRYAIDNTGLGARELPPIPTPDPVNHVLLDREGGLWIHAGATVFRWHHGSLVPVLEDIPRSGFFEDREGSLWIATAGVGLWQVLPPASFEVDVVDLPDPLVWTAAEGADGDLWVGTARGLVRLTDGGYGAVPGLESHHIYSLAVGARDLWIGAEHGLFRHSLDANRGTPERIPLPPDSRGRQRGVRGDILPTPAGDLWVAAHDGLLHLVPTTHGGGGYHVERVVRVGPDGEERPRRIRALHLDAAGNLWIGSEVDGLWRLDHNALAPVPLPGLDPWIGDLWSDTDGTLWMATRSDGVVRLRDGRAAAVTRAQGLFDETVHHFLPDGLGWMWMASNRGVWKVRFEDLEAVADGRQPHLDSEVFGNAEGLLNVECNSGHPGSALLADGRIVVPTMEGLAWVDPARPRKNTVPPGVEITAVSANYAPIPFDRFSEPSPLRLLPHQRTLAIDYVASTYVMPSKAQFSYRLEGFDDTWVDAGTRRMALYTDLGPGEYTFRVRAANPDGVWSVDDATLTLEVVPEWHELSAVRGLFFVLSGGVFVGLGWLLGRRYHLWQHAPVFAHAQGAVLQGRPTSGPQDDSGVIRISLHAADPPAVESADQEFLRRVLEAVEANLHDSGFGVFELAEAVHLSRRQLHRKLVALTEETPAALLRRIRLERAEQLLRGGVGSVAEVSRAVGYTKPAHFSELFKRTYGKNPSALMG